MVFTAFSIVKEINIGEEVVRNLPVIRAGVKCDTDFGREASFEEIANLHRKTNENKRAHKSSRNPSTRTNKETPFHICKEFPDLVIRMDQLPNVRE